MRKRVKSLLSFLSALVLTAAVVMALSAMTARPAGYNPPSARTQQAGAQELSAALPEEKPAVGKSILGFGVILMVSLAGGVLYLNARYKQPKPVKRRSRRPQPPMPPVIVKRV